MNATDDDFGLNGRITYRIHSGHKDNFRIIPETGVVQVNSGADLDMDRNGDRYDMIVSHTNHKVFLISFNADVVLMEETSIKLLRELSVCKPDVTLVCMCLGVCCGQW